MNCSIVFDLDGTLITCENKQKYVLSSILNSIEYIDPEKIDYWWKLKRNGFNTEKALSEIGISNAKLISDNWISTIENFAWCSLDKPFTDSLPALEFLKVNHELNIIILTARRSAFQVSQAIFSYGFNEFIDDLIVVSPEKVIQEKTHNLKRIKPLMYIGDSETDHLASINSKTRFVALARGQRSRDFLKKIGAMQIENNLKFLKNDDSISRFKKDQ